MRNTVESKTRFKKIQKEIKKVCGKRRGNIQNFDGKSWRENIKWPKLRKENLEYRCLLKIKMAIYVKGKPGSQMFIKGKDNNLLGTLKI